MTITTRGFDSLLQTLDNIASGADERVELITEFLAVEVALPVAQDMAPVKTGFLVENISAEQIEAAHWIVISEAFYSVFQEFGFMHYRDGFIPGKFFMTQGKEAVDTLIESGGLSEIIATSLETSVVYATEDTG